jgi:hypothetical protein
MPDLIHSLRNKDSGFIRILASLWGIDLQATPQLAEPSSDPTEILAAAMLMPGRLESVLEALPAEAKQTLQELARSQGQLEWAGFARRFGAVREMGPGRRDRELPHLRPASPAETLWYRGLIARAFLDTPGGPQEFAYIPSDLLARLPESQTYASRPGRSAAPAEAAHFLLCNDTILDHACTLLAAVRLGLKFDSPEFNLGGWETGLAGAPTAETLFALLSAADLIAKDTGLPNPELSRHFLELPRSKALALLARTWQHNPAFNELRLLPGLRCEGEWQNDPLLARYTVVENLRRVPSTAWWSLDSFIQYIKQDKPDFQRPAGDYDSWYIRDLASGEYLRGFGAWERVDGALLRFLIHGPMYWLGIVDLASPAPGEPVTAFRPSAWAANLLDGAPPSGLEAEEENLLVSSDARLRVPRLTPRSARYQIARFCAWEAASPEAYAYRITPASLDRARQQGLRISHLQTLLQRHALTVPPRLARALQRWEDSGVEAALERVWVLRVRSPEILQSLRSSKYARFLGEPLGPTSITVKPNAGPRIVSALAELGYLAEIETPE